MLEETKEQLASLEERLETFAGASLTSTGNRNESRS